MMRWRSSACIMAWRTGLSDNCGSSLLSGKCLMELASVRKTMEVGIAFQHQTVFHQQRPHGRIGVAGLQGNHAHRRFGHHIQANDIDVGSAEEVIVKGLQLGELGRTPFLQLVGAGADGRRAVGVFADLGMILGLDDMELEPSWPEKRRSLCPC